MTDRDGEKDKCPFTCLLRPWRGGVGAEASVKIAKPRQRTVWHTSSGKAGKGAAHQLLSTVGQLASMTPILTCEA